MMCAAIGSRRIYLGENMAAPKSSSRKPASKKKAVKTGKSKAVVKKTAKPARQPAAVKKKTAKKAVKKEAAAARKKRPTAVTPMVSPAVAELDQRIAIVRNNLRDLTEIATASSGASNEELASERIAEQEEELRTLTKQREELVRRKG
ncbi:hypothetical protein [Reyranella sp.]|uniref:hypothetical protein n=1 Tax=Reyranella sp. TaxID=1929291 RepID=UPI003D09B35B